MTFEQRVTTLLNCATEDVFYNLYETQEDNTDIFDYALISINHIANGTDGDYTDWVVYKFTDQYNRYSDLLIKFEYMITSYEDPEFRKWAFVKEVTKPTFEEI